MRMCSLFKPKRPYSLRVLVLEQDQSHLCLGCSTGIQASKPSNETAIKELWYCMKHAKAPPAQRSRTPHTPPWTFRASSDPNAQHQDFMSGAIQDTSFLYDHSLSEELRVLEEMETGTNNYLGDVLPHGHGGSGSQTVQRLHESLQTQGIVRSRALPFRTVRRGSNNAQPELFAPDWQTADPAHPAPSQLYGSDGTGEGGGQDTQEAEDYVVEDWTGAMIWGQLRNIRQ
ncbi:hypothetical protein GGR54DRAFT_641049 [Hypoxylon sp. NC1633]|nr:hypothetical protein GGR54DRAFT_641049 [Hypoxylon sp. NC1633]